MVLPDALAPVLAEHLEARQYGAEWMFPGENGPVVANSVTYWWSKAHVSAKAPGVPLHDLRTSTRRA